MIDSSKYFGPVKIGLNKTPRPFFGNPVIDEDIDTLKKVGLAPYGGGRYFVNSYSFHDNMPINLLQPVHDEIKFTLDGYLVTADLREYIDGSYKIPHHIAEKEDTQTEIMKIAVPIIKQILDDIESLGIDSLKELDESHIWELNYKRSEDDSSIILYPFDGIISGYDDDYRKFDTLLTLKEQDENTCGIGIINPEYEDWLALAKHIHTERGVSLEGKINNPAWKYTPYFREFEGHERRKNFYVTGSTLGEAFEIATKIKKTEIPNLQIQEDRERQKMFSGAGGPCELGHDY